MPRPTRLFGPPFAVGIAALAAALAGCHTAPKTDTEREILIAQSDLAITKFKAADPSIQGFFDTASGYAVFPRVGKGGAGVGGARGRGVLYENDDVVGFCDLSQVTIGFQLGGQSYSQIVFFDTPQKVTEFKGGEFAFAAQASAVAATAGASADVDYENGVAVFTLARGGLMGEASIGGQSFDYVPR